MATPKVIVQLYPVLPAEDRADRERKRPLGRNSELYHRVLHESLDLVERDRPDGSLGHQHDRAPSPL